MASPLRAVHVMLAPEQITYLRLEAAQRHMSVSSLMRELVTKEQARLAASSERKRRRREVEARGHRPF